ncbi:MAG: nicotinate (nicotinamide) nucleotide adenylyltransferase [Gammaproteobacteria bacterium]|nr:nicotinate (nicotinamide) nucleotide adenylyltransferase [Gammaproteobacteria bacterium]
MTKKTQKIGIFGGSFDPIHLGHLNLAETILKQFELDRIIFIPCSQTPGKDSPKASNQDRINMLKLTTQSNDKFSINLCEIERSGVSYTIDTLNELKAVYPNAEFYLIMSQDQFNDFTTTWFEWQEILETAKLIVANRPGSTLYIAPILKKYISFGIIQLIQIDPYDISSTKIRDLIRHKKEFKHLVPQLIADYIKKHHLYL